MKVDSFAKKMSGQKWRKGEVIEVDDGITFVSYPKTFVDDPAPPLDFPYSVRDWIKARGTLVIKNDTNRKPDGSHDYPIEEHHKVPC